MTRVFEYKSVESKKILWAPYQFSAVIFIFVFPPTDEAVLDRMDEIIELPLLKKKKDCAYKIIHEQIYEEGNKLFSTLITVIQK